MIDMKADGLVEAQNMILYLQKLGASTKGIALYAESRAEDSRLTNADIINFQAEGVRTKRGTIKRDITPTEGDADAAAKVYLKRAERTLRTLTNKRKGLTLSGKPRKVKGKAVGVNKGVTVQSMANSAQASGLKAAGNLIVERLRKRVLEQIDNDGTILQPVDPDYADRRFLKYGVPDESVLTATGQLLRNLERGKLRLSKVQGLAEAAQAFLGK